MNRSRLLGILCALFLAQFTLSAKAALFSRYGGKLVFDSDLNITWLADGNLAESNTFGVAGVDATGLMSWNAGEPQAWIIAMNDANYLEQNNWRLPNTLQPDPSCSQQTMGHMD